MEHAHVANDQGASEFKAKCLAIMDEIERTGQAVVITKNGKPVAELVPHRPRKKAEEECTRHLEGSLIHHWRHHLPD
jgi:prevent-host-death family protein